ncbi:F-box protein CPR1-like [Coffea eugenioides]|uniref:F-box protein CPR1-like n=1 Tax=Coffea eugenioides TaxID=49369 RepID=UPI000F60A38E|nr:F-box protein CPR1-like [Coffea eugenioides]
MGSKKYIGSRGSKPSSSGLPKVSGLRLQQENMPHLPQEIINSEILPRLPVKSLLRFRCVNKLWNSTIVDPRFNRHNARSMAVFMSADLRAYLPSLKLPWLQSIEKLPGLKFTDEEGSIQRFPLVKLVRDNKGFIGGSCNGLLLVILGSSFYLWNPSTAYFCHVLELDYLDGLASVSITGLCYDSSSEDYKVVVKLKLPVKNFGKSVLVAALKDKRWKGLKFPHSGWGRGRAVLCNGILHWEWDVYRPDMVNSKRIIGFDPKTDQIVEVPLPQCKNREDSVILGLGIIECYLCTVQWDNPSYFKGNFQLMVMKEYGVKESWTPMFEIVREFPALLISSRMIPLMLNKNGELLMIINYQRIVSYNPRTAEYKSILPSTQFVAYSADVFVESLISPAGYDWKKTL